ncbi:MAG: MlaD family protein [Planctomycetota bacterium]
MALQRDTLLGLVFFGTLALVGWASLSLTSVSFEEKKALVVYFQNAQGLRTGDAVLVLGKRMGQVRGVSFEPAAGGSPIRVELELDEDVALAQDMRIEIRDASLLGGRQIEIDPGTSGPSPTEPLVGNVRPSPLDQLGEADLTGTLDSVRTFFDRLVDPQGSVGALLASRQVFDDLAGTLAGVRRVVAEVERGEGTLGRVIYSTEMADDLAGILQGLRSVSAKIDEGAGPLARLVNDEQLGADLAGAVADVKDLTGRARRGEGLLGRLLTSEDLADELDNLLASLSSVATKLDDPNAGLLPALIGDPELGAQAREFVAGLNDITTKINSGEGLLATLINDADLGRELTRLFGQVTGAIEDAREAAPVGTFFQVIAAPF